MERRIKGVIVDLRQGKEGGEATVTVRYRVHGNKYELREPLAFKDTPLKIGFLTIGHRRVPVMPNIAIGTSTIVIYDPTNPTHARIRDNIPQNNLV